MDTLQIDVEAAAMALLEQTRQASDFVSLPEHLRPVDIHTAYQIQQRVEALRPVAERAGGYKVSCMTQTSRAYFGLSQPVFARIRGDRILRDGACIPPSPRFARGFECEIAVRVSVTEQGAKIGSMMPALEVIERRYAQATAATFPTMLADCLYNAGCVIGAESRDWDDASLAMRRVRALVDGVEIAERRIGDVIGHPRHAVEGLLVALNESNLRIEPDSIVLTGSLCGEIWLEPGQTVAAEFEGLGRVNARLDTL